MSEPTTGGRHRPTRIPDLPAHADAVWSDRSDREMTVTRAGLTHRIRLSSEWADPRGSAYTDWLSACGSCGTETGRFRTGVGTFGRRVDMLRVMACPRCWPGVRGGAR